MLIRSIKQREIQLAITRYATNDQGIAYLPVYEEPINLIVSPDHPFANRKVMSFPEIVNETFITYQKNTKYRDILDMTINQLNKKYVAKYEMNNLRLIKHFIAKNRGVHLSSGIYMRDEIIKKELVLIKIEPNPFPISQIFIAYLKDEMNSMDQSFIKHFQMQVGNPSLFGAPEV